MKAPQAAGIIHSDPLNVASFVRRQSLYQDLVTYRRPPKRLVVRSEGKEYVVQDGDIMLFRFNV